ncbi:hypothetical protein X777_00650 [Ooceraea biroi]|uniref:Uncharacterized protein n=1 Tax=Ooceraea biroi TaxID=2015173 RepID=A0A026X1X5_OOCBI|nr:hypothetical protein X777_00650 [Ooceraea biroi]
MVEKEEKEEEEVSAIRRDQRTSDEDGRTLSMELRREGARETERRDREHEPGTTRPCEQERRKERERSFSLSLCPSRSRTFDDNLQRGSFFLRARKRPAPRDRVPAAKRDPDRELLCSRSCEISNAEKRQRRKAEETVRKVSIRAEGSREKGSSEKGNLRIALSDLHRLRVCFCSAVVSVQLPDECIAHDKGKLSCWSSVCTIAHTIRL